MTQWEAQSVAAGPSRFGSGLSSVPRNIVTVHGPWAMDCEAGLLSDGRGDGGRRPAGLRVVPRILHPDLELDLIPNLSMPPHTATIRACIIAICWLGAASREGAAQQPSSTLPKGESNQVVDTMFPASAPKHPAFAEGRGPRVMIDEAHHNFHTAGGRFRPFAKWLASDGFRVVAGTTHISASSLASTQILVIANALAARDVQVAAWRLPTTPAFTADEVDAIVAWVRGGGALLLIADHMPFPGAIAPLAAAIGADFANGFALFGSKDPRTGDYPIVFRRRDGTLLPGPIVDGRNASERIDSIETFTGTAFHLSGRRGGGGGILALPVGTRLELPIVAWQFSDTTPAMRADGLLQGAAFAFGRGRVAVFGEAGMFTAQRKGVDRVPMGFNDPAASQNPQFILNLLHWLAGMHLGG